MPERSICGHPPVHRDQHHQENQRRDQEGRSKHQQHENHHPVADKRFGKRRTGKRENFEQLDFRIRGQRVVFDKDPLDPCVERIGIRQAKEQQNRRDRQDQNHRSHANDHRTASRTARICGGIRQFMQNRSFPTLLLFDR